VTFKPVSEVTQSAFYRQNDLQQFSIGLSLSLMPVRPTVVFQQTRSITARSGSDLIGDSSRIGEQYMLALADSAV